MEQNKNDQKPTGQGSTPFAQTYFHGTKADLKIGDLVEVLKGLKAGDKVVLRPGDKLDHGDKVKTVTKK